MNKLVYVGALVSLLASSAAAQTLTGFATSKAGEGVEIRILGEKLSQPRLFKLGKDHYAVEFAGSLSGKSHKEALNYGGVKSVSSYWLSSKPPKVRIGLTVEPGAFVAVSEDAGTYVIGVNVTSSAMAFKDVPGLSKPATVKEERAYKSPLATVVARQARPVTLDFVNTDVVQILKALAMQSGVNIVTAPEVKGALTVSLKNVAVTEALDLVTTLANVRYAKVGKTYVVSSNERFSDTMRSIGGTIHDSSETRVVPIYSGEGTQIKAAVLKSATQGASVEIVLPSEELKVSKKDVVGGEDNPTPAGAGDTVVESKSANTAGNVAKKPDAYVVLIGPVQRLEEYERLVRAVDDQICRAVGIEVPSTSTMVRKLYRPKGSTAAALLQAVSGEKPTAGGVFKAKMGSVELFATPANSISDQVIVLYGRETEVNQLLTNMENVDAVGESRGDFLMYEVRHLDPRSLREELLVQVPGLSVSIPSNAAANPNLYRGGAIKDESAQRVGASGAEAGAKADESAREGVVNLGADSGQDQGLTLPFRDAEKVAVPMKLVLRGSKDQIQRALSYLQVVDVAPKQVALELRVMDISKEQAHKFGLDWNVLTGGTVKSLRFNNGIETSNSNPGTAGAALGFAGAGALNVLATLDDIATDRNLIARPNLMAIDGRETEIFVGDVVRYIESIQATQNGISVETGEVPVGVRLAVLPRIGGDGQLTLDLRPAVTTLNGFTPVPGGGSLPQTGLRIAQSTMTIKSGETIAIGGLIQDVDRKRDAGVPFLKDLPIIGMLFKRVENSRTRSEIVFFLTARIVDSSDRATAADPRTGSQSGPNDKVGG